MAYQAPYSGLAQLMEMQGRGPDTRLVHMTPMELRTLQAMSPTGRLTTNPETGLPEAGILEDILPIALPIAGAVAAPYLLPAIGLTGLSGVAAGAIGTGVGSTLGGLVQGKGLGDSLIQGGLSGLMSYGLGSAFAPATAAAPQSAAGVPTATTPDLSTGISDPITGAAIDPNMELVAGLPTAPTPSLPGLMAPNFTTPDPASVATLNQSLVNAGAGTPTSELGAFLGTSDAVPYTGATDVFAPVAPDAGMIGKAKYDLFTSSPDFLGSTAIGGTALGPTQLPTYGTAGTAALSGALAAPVGQGLGLMAPDEMPYDIADMYDMDAYYASRIPDLRLGRLRGQAAARQLKSPPSFLTSGGLYERAISPGGGGTFFAADGGQVPRPYGDPYGPGDPYGGMADETDFGQPSGTGQSADVGPGMSLGSFNEPVADIGLGQFNPTPMSLGLTALGMVPGPIGMIANVANIGRGLANVMGPSVPGQVTGFGTTTGGPTGIGIGVTGQAVDPDFEAVSEGYGGTGMGGEDSGSGDQGDTGVGHGAGEGTSEEGAADYAQGGVVEAGIGGLLKALSPAALATDTLGIADVDKLKIKDMLGMLSPAAFFAKDPKRLKYLSPAYMASQKPSALSPAATVMMNRGMAQGGGISSLAYGGDPAPIGFANQAFEGMVPGPGTGMSDDVPFSIEGNQPALLSRDEYVLPADVVSQLGDGSSSAGADMLDNFISQVRQTKYGNTQQPAPVGPQLMTGLMRQGGVV